MLLVLHGRACLLPRSSWPNGWFLSRAKNMIHGTWPNSSQQTIVLTAVGFYNALMYSYNYAMVMHSSNSRIMYALCSHLLTHMLWTSNCSSLTVLSWECRTHIFLTTQNVSLTYPLRHSIAGTSCSAPCLQYRSNKLNRLIT